MPASSRMLGGAYVWVKIRETFMYLSVPDI